MEAALYIGMCSTPPMDPSTLGVSSPRAFIGYSVLGSILVFVLIFKAGKKKNRLPPGPPAWPIVGNLFQLGSKLNESLYQLSKKYGPLMTLQLGMKTAVVISSPAIAKEVLKDNDQIFAGRTILQALTCHYYDENSLVLSQYGPRWRMLRKLCNTQLFNAKRLEALQHLRTDQVFRMVQHIYEESLKSNAVDIGHAVFLTSLNLIGNMICTQNMFDSNSSSPEEFKEIVWKYSELVGAPNAADFFPFLQWLDLQGVKRKGTTYVKWIFDVFDECIEKRLASREINNLQTEEKDFLDILLDSGVDGSTDFPIFTRPNIKGLLLDLFIAGSETNASTIEWAMAELTHKPQTMNKAQSEVEKTVGCNRKVEESDTERLPYIQAVVKEALRLHPPVPLLLPHRADASCEIAGFVIPKNSHVIVNAWAIGRDPASWNDPLEFIPERFLECERDYKGHDFELIPFGAGRRICAGIPLASRMLPFILACLLHSFNWSLPDGMRGEELDMSDKFGATQRKAIPLNSIPTQRLPSHLYTY
eukprot:Gb_41086 [translate_table: standard]